MKNNGKVRDVYSLTCKNDGYERLYPWDLEIAYSCISTFQDLRGSSNKKCDKIDILKKKMYQKPKYSYIFIGTSVLFYAMFPSFWCLGNTGCEATNDTMYNISGHLSLLLDNALKRNYLRHFFKIIGEVITDMVHIM